LPTSETEATLMAHGQNIARWVASELIGDSAATTGEPRWA
jgi:hypothetical protein